MSKKHYVDNKKLFEEIVKYKEKLRQAEKDKVEKPIVSNYVAKCFLDIAQNLGNHNSYRNYPFLDEMITDGVYNCLKYIDTFDPTKTQNPFNYFTTTIQRAFLRRIALEKKYLYVKFKCMENYEIFEKDAEFGETLTYTVESKEKIDDFVEKFETNIELRKERNNKKNESTED